MQTYDIITFGEEGSDEALIEALLFFRVYKRKKEQLSKFRKTDDAMICEEIENR